MNNLISVYIGNSLILVDRTKVSLEISKQLLIFLILITLLCACWQICHIQIDYVFITFLNINAPLSQAILNDLHLHLL